MLPLLTNLDTTKIRSGVGGGGDSGGGGGGGGGESKVRVKDRKTKGSKETRTNVSGLEAKYALQYLDRACNDLRYYQGYCNCCVSYTLCVLYQVYSCAIDVP